MVILARYTCPCISLLYLDALLAVFELDINLKGITVFGVFQKLVP